MVGPAILMHVVPDAGRQTLRFAADGEPAYRQVAVGCRAAYDSKSAMSSEPGSDWAGSVSRPSPARTGTRWAGARQRTSASMVDVVASVRSVAPDSGRSLSRRARSRSTADERGMVASVDEEEAGPSWVASRSQAIPPPGPWRRSAPAGRQRPPPHHHHPRQRRQR